MAGDKVYKSQEGGDYLMEKVYEELEVVYVKADDVEQILFTAEHSQLAGDINNDRSLIESTEVLHDVKALPLEEHITSSQWLSTIHSGSDSGRLKVFV